MSENYETEIFCKNMVWLRKKYGLTQKEMAAKLQISLYTVSMLEKGKMPPRMDATVLHKIYCVFGLTPSEQFSPQWN